MLNEIRLNTFRPENAGAEWAIFLVKKYGLIKRYDFKMSWWLTWHARQYLPDHGDCFNFDIKWWCYLTRERGDNDSYRS